MSDALVVDNVSKSFGDIVAVKGLTFRAGQGDILALLGPNGAGKTTTVDMCEGFTTPTSGRISVLGLDPAREPEKVRSRIGIMLQGGGSYSGIRVRELLHLTARYNEDPLDPDWLLDLLGLSGVANTTYRRLSGGQQQRLSLALALIGRPELVFLDEPTAGMDAQSRLAVWEIISALKRDGVTVIVTTHLMDEAEALADQVVIIDHGAVVAEGTPADLISRNSRPVLSFSTDRELDLNELDGVLSPLSLNAQATRPLRYQVSGEVSPEAIASIAVEAQRQSVLIRQLDVAQRTLEDVFLDITGRQLRS